MRKWLLYLVSVSIAGVVLAAAAHAGPNSGGSWQLHYGGPHNPRTNHCGLRIIECSDAPRGDVVVNAPGDPGRYDIYVLALEVEGIAGTRYGICCDGSFYFYGWTKCCDFEIPTSGWPGNGEGNAQTWSSKQPGPHVTVGILDIYVYSASSMCICRDPRVGFAEYCDASFPQPECDSTSESAAFGCVGFGKPGYNSCGWEPDDDAEHTTWGRLKAAYR